MPRASTKTTASSRYWQRRLASPAFARELTALIAEDLRVLAGEPCKDLIDVGMVREIINRMDDLVVVDAIAPVLANLRRTTRLRLRQTRGSLHSVLGEQLVRDVDGLIDAMTDLTGNAKALIEGMMERELVQSLMTDLVYTAIVSFNKRVNPLFGNLALMAMDSQIKSFIRMFMPMLQRQATAFLIDRKNRALFADFLRAAARQILNAPVRELVDVFDGGSDAAVETFIAKNARNPHLRRLARDTALELTDVVMREIGRKRVGTLVALDANADWLAKRLSVPLLGALKRPHVAAFFAREIERATKART